MKKILVALSGGLDSAATTRMLQKQGMKTTALFINMHNNPQMTQQAHSVANKLKTELIVVDAHKEFQNTVLKYFYSQLQKGLTPAPCSFCNPYLKWKILYQTALDNNINLIASGHYVNTIQINGNTYIKQSPDSSKDQSYYLWDMPQEILRKTIFPLSEYNKSQVREFLRNEGLDDIAMTRESMSLCFIPNNATYADFIKQNMTIHPGDVVDQSGKLVGKHIGTQIYTIGQRKGFELFDKEDKKSAVLKIDSLTNRLVVSDQESDFLTKRLWLKNWRVEDFSLLRDSDLRVVVRGLGLNPIGGCFVERIGDLLKVDLHGEAWAVAPGQPAVFYKDNVVVGGGYLL